MDTTVLMAWARLDDGYHANPKILAAGLAATGLHARAVSFCAQQETDGHVPAAWIAGQLVEFKPAAQQRVVQSLVDAGLFVARNGGFVVNDYLDYNPSKASLDKRRAQDTKRKKRERSSDV